MKTLRRLGTAGWLFLAVCITIGALQSGKFLQFGGIALICFAMAIHKKKR